MNDKTLALLPLFSSPHHHFTRPSLPSTTLTTPLVLSGHTHCATTAHDVTNDDMQTPVVLQLPHTWDRPRGWTAAGVAHGVAPQVKVHKCCVYLECITECLGIHVSVFVFCCGNTSLKRNPMILLSNSSIVPHIRGQDE